MNMGLIHDVKSISRLILILLLLISFIVGALLSYIWTMGYYAPQVFHLPRKASVTIEKVEFFAENATYFNVTLLNPSYSPSTATIEQILVLTNDDLIHKVTDTSPSLSSLAPGDFQTFQAFWNWGNYTGQLVNVIVLIADGSGPALKVGTSVMNLATTSPVFNASDTLHFKVTVRNDATSQAKVDITKVVVDVRGERVTIEEVSPLLPLPLQPNSDVLLTCSWNWSGYSGENAKVTVLTLQGFVASSLTPIP